MTDRKFRILTVSFLASIFSFSSVLAMIEIYAEESSTNNTKGTVTSEDTDTKVPTEKSEFMNNLISSHLVINSFILNGIFL